MDPFTRALDIVEKEGITKKNRKMLFDLTDKILKKTDVVRVRGKTLIRLDEALKRFDLKWFHRTHAVNPSHLSKTQLRAMRENITEERKRIKAEEEMEKLELEIGLHIQAMQDYINKCRKSISLGNGACTKEWLKEAFWEDRRAKDIDDKIDRWEKRLLKLIIWEKKELAASS